MIQEIPYAGWKRNLRLRGPSTELVITLEVGPRIMRYAFHNGKNVFAEMPEQLGGSGEKEWMIRGGHRFWTAPEADHSYDLDNSPVDYRKIGESAVEIIQSVGKFNLQKTLRVELLKDETVRLTHLLTNVGGKPLAITPWALTVMAPGGTALIPQPRIDLHPSEFPEGRQTEPDNFLPNRELILWPFTDLTDGRYAFSENFLRVTWLPERPATKIGLKLPTGWIAYQNESDVVFAKHFAYDPKPPYPDRGCNFELFTNTQIFELESLAPSLPLEPDAVIEHVEHWALRKTSADLRKEAAATEFFSRLPALP
jgi:hypothetical protein